MAKWGILSDTQFDEQLSYATIGPDGISSRLADSMKCFDWIIDGALLRKCEGLIHLGDFFNSRTAIDVSVLDQVGRRVFRAHDEGLRLFLMAGNHDSYLRNASINSLWPFAGIAEVFDEPMEHAGFAFLPWVEDDDVFEEHIEMLSKTKAEFLFAHCMVEGAVPNVHGVRSVASLRPKRWKQVILGDVHDPVQVAPNVRYAGSPMQWHYGDAGRKRGFLILDDETGEVEFIENEHSPRFHLLKEVDTSDVKEDDFVRIESDDGDVVRAIEKEIGGLTLQRLESTLVEIESVAPRLDVRVTNTHEDVLRRYVEHVGMKEVEGLVDLGVEILDEAQHG